MTKEENIATLNEHLDHWKRLLSEKICDQDEGEKTIDALQNAIKALEQEPKMGHWIDIDDSKSECSICGHREFNERFLFEDINFCAKCGAKMVKQQESEVKE